jgi:flagellar hook-basal body complex protein FliE
MGLKSEVEGFSDNSFQPMLDSALGRVNKAEKEYRLEMERLIKEMRVELSLHDIVSRNRIGRVSLDCARNLLNDGALAIVTLHCRGCGQQLDVFGLDRLL